MRNCRRRSRSWRDLLVELAGVDAKPTPELLELGKRVVDAGPVNDTGHLILQGLFQILLERREAEGQEELQDLLREIRYTGDSDLSARKVRLAWARERGEFQRAQEDGTFCMRCCPRASRPLRKRHLLIGGTARIGRGFRT